MHDLIDRQAAIKEIEGLHDCYNGFSDTYDKACIIGVLEDLPPAQAEIIRCKDCKWCKELHDSFDGAPYWMCKNWDAETDTDGFCYEAERRADDGE